MVEFRRARPTFPRNPAMLDIILIAIGCGTFVLAIAYAYACDKL
jgi:hypothetical protein